MTVRWEENGDWRGKKVAGAERIEMSAGSGRALPDVEEQKQGLRGKTVHM